MQKVSKIIKNKISEKPAKGSVPAKVLSALKKVNDPETNQPLLDSGMLKNIKVNGKKISMKLVPLNFGCAFCGMIGVMTEDVKTAMKKIGYEAEVEIGF